MPRRAGTLLADICLQAVDTRKIIMRIDSGIPRALQWQLDAEHEAFRGLGARSAIRLCLVLAAIVMVFGLAAAGFAAAPAGHLAQSGPVQQTIAWLGLS
jgi:hypothetical protein